MDFFLQCQSSLAGMTRQWYKHYYVTHAEIQTFAIVRQATHPYIWLLQHFLNDHARPANSLFEVARYLDISTRFQEMFVTP